MPRGGRRSGNQYSKYANRSDLRAPKPLPVTTATGQAYGVAKQQADAQRAIPLGPQSQPAPVGTGGVPTPIVPQASPTGAPTPVVPLDAPTQRPNEPLTAGVDVGVGPGAPVAPPTADPQRMKAWLPALEVLAEMPDASDETRNLVRYWRSILAT